MIGRWLTNPIKSRITTNSGAHWLIKLWNTWNLAKWLLMIGNQSVNTVNTAFVIQLYMGWDDKNRAFVEQCRISWRCDFPCHRLKRKTLLPGMAYILAICPDKKPGESLVSDSKQYKTYDSRDPTSDWWILSHSVLKCVLEVTFFTFLIRFYKYNTSTGEKPRKKAVTLRLWEFVNLPFILIKLLGILCRDWLIGSITSPSLFRLIIGSSIITKSCISWIFDVSPVN